MIQTKWLRIQDSLPCAGFAHNNQLTERASTFQMISLKLYAVLRLSVYATRVTVNQYLAECCVGIWILAFNSWRLDRCHSEMDTAE